MRSKFFLILITPAFCFNLYGQQSYSSTFLWRISGKGLNRPSYLFGTMHLQDRKLFYFGDSIYHAIEMCDGFSMEINPAEMMDSLFKTMDKQDKSPLIKNLLSESEYNKVAGKLAKKFKKPADKITAKAITGIKDQWIYKYKRKDDMPTFMDLYLYTIAQKLGKSTGGIEDLQDQIGLMDEIDLANIEEYLNEDEKSNRKYLSDLKEIYINRDINKVQERTYGHGKTAYNDLVLIKRNIKMARRMDSLAQIRSSFFAVGAAHLPGDSGLITLLKKRGYKIDPVISSTYLKPEDYHYTAKTIEWKNVEDEHNMCSVQMPGQPSVVNLSGILPMQMYFDLGNLFLYGVTVVALPSDSQNDSLLSKLVANYKKLGFDIISKKNMDKLQAKGIEMTVKNEKYFYRFQVLIKSNKLFMLLFGAQQEENLNASDGIKFFNSLIINDTSLARLPSWQLFTDEENAFSIYMPGKPTLKLDKASSKTMYHVYTYVSSDYSDGSYYMVVVKNAIPGYYIKNDSLNFTQYKEYFNSITDSGNTQFSELNIQGYHALKMTGMKRSEGRDYFFQMNMVRRGNRIYLPMAVTQKDKQNSAGVNKFFETFNISPFQTSKWNRELSPKNNFSAWAPSKFQVDNADSLTKSNTLRTFFSHDKNTVVTYSVETQTYPRYFWSTGDSSFFREMTDQFKTAEDTLISYRLHTGDTSGADILIKINKSGMYKRMKTLLNGDTLYTLYSYIPEELKTDSNINLFFEGFTFITPGMNTIFKNKQEQLLISLQSADSATRAEAQESLDQITFGKSDLDFLHRAWIISYPVETRAYINTNHTIGYRIQKINDSATIDFIQKNYNKVKNDSVSLQMNMLVTLAKLKSEKSYALLKNLLIQNSCPAGRVYELSEALQDSLLLSARLFPEIAKLYSDTIMGSALAKTTINLIDSNLIDSNIVKQNAELIYTLSKYQLKKLKTEADIYPLYINYVIDLLEKLHTTESIKLLNNFMNTPSIAVKYDATIALLTLKHVVDFGTLQKIAADRQYRTELYSALKKLNKTALFPGEFYTQQKFAESYIYGDVYNDEEDIVSLVALGEKTTKAGKKSKRYYLFRLNTNDDDEPASHLAICGPFTVDRNKIELNEDERQVKVFYDQKYDPANTDKLFKQFINPDKTQDLNHQMNKYKTCLV